MLDTGAPPRGLWEMCKACAGTGKLTRVVEQIEPHPTKRFEGTLVKCAVTLPCAPCSGSGQVLV